MKIRYSILVFSICGLFCLNFSVFSQSYDDLILIDESCQDINIKKDTTFYSDSLYRSMNEGLMIETLQPPEFPGGENALIEFFKKNMNYPEQAISDRFEGKVLLIFTITPEGCIGRLRITENASSEIMNECVRVIKILPRFKPATTMSEANKGWYWKPTTIWYGVTLYFSLENDSDKHPITIVPKTQL